MFFLDTMQCPREGKDQPAPPWRGPVDVTVTNRLSILGSTLVALAMLHPSALGDPGGAFFVPLGDLPGGPFESEAFAISADGTTVVGRSRSAPDQGTNQSVEAFRWTLAGGMVGLGDLDPTVVFSWASDVSADGSVIVGVSDTAFVWTQASGMVPFVDTSGAFTGLAAASLSADGSAIAGPAHPVTGGMVAMRWTSATGAVNLGALPNDFGVPDASATAISADGSVVTGQSLIVGSVANPIRWTQATGLVGMGDVPGGVNYAIAWGISGDGRTIVGGTRTSHNRDEAFVWREDTGFLLLDPLHGAVAASVAQAASHDGSVVVGYDGNLGGPMIWDAVHGRRNPQQILQDDFGIDLNGWDLRGVSDVSADGMTIVGTGRNPSGQFESWVARIPRMAPPVPALSPAALIVLIVAVTSSAAVLARRLQDPRG